MSNGIKINNCLTECYSIIVDIVYYSGGGRTVTVTFWKVDGTQVKKEYNDDTVIRSVVSFYHGHVKHITVFKELIGFIPYYDTNENGKNVYVPESVFLARQKPIEMCEYHGVQIPKAFMNEIEVAHGIVDAFGNNDVIKEPMTGEWQDMLIPALEKLTSGEKFTLSDIKVFDYIGIIHIVTMGEVFINGDKIYQDTTKNRLLCGNVNPNTLEFNIPKFPVGENIPKTIIELGRVYKLLCETIRLSNNPEMGYELVLAAQLFAEKHCGLKF
jgi:hypothetical protein